MNENRNDITFKAVLGTLSTLGFVSLILLPRLFSRMQAPGPRLEPGEMKARESSLEAEQQYWKAEEAASRGKCPVARRHFDRAEAHRHMADQRREKGDHTGFDLRDAVRQARREMEKCDA